MTQSSRATDLLYALNAAAVTIQRNVRSEDEVLRAFQEQTLNIGLRGGIFVLADDGQHLRVLVSAASIEHDRQIGHMNIAGFHEFLVSLEDSIGIRRFLETTQARFFDSDNEVDIRSLLEPLHKYSREMSELYHGNPMIYAPMTLGESGRGILVISGERICEADILAVIAFANHVSIALQNAALFTSLKSEIEQRERFQLELQRSHYDNASDRMKFEETLQRKANELEALYELSLDITSAHEITNLLQRIVKRAVSLLRTMGGSLYLCDPERGLVQLVVEFHSVSEDLVGVELRYGEGAAGTVAVTGEPLIIDDYRIWPGRAKIFDATQPYSAVLSVPMIWQGEVTGVLQVIDDHNKRLFNSGDQELLALFANQAAVAIENTRLLESERRKAGEAETIRKATAALTSSLELDDVLESILAQMEKVVPYNSATIFLSEQDLLRAVALKGFSNPSELKQLQFSLEEDELGSIVCETQTHLILKDAAKDPRFKAWGESANVHGWLGVPLIVRDEVIGLLTLDSSTPGAYDNHNAGMAQAFANQAAIAIENARLFETEGKRAAELEALRRASLSLTASLELPEVLDAILRSAIQFLTDVGNAHVFLYDHSKDKLSFGAALLGDGRLGVQFAEPRQNGLTYNVARYAEMIIVEDMHAHPLFEDTPADWNGAIVGLPLKVGDRVLGVMNISYKIPRHFSERELWILQMLGDQAAIAIENARLYEAAARERSHLRLLYDVGRSLGASLEPVELMRRALELTCETLEGFVGQAYLFMEEENRLEMCALYGRPDAYRQQLNRAFYVTPGMGLVGWVTRNKEAVYVPNVNQDKRWFHVDGVDDDVVSALCAPVLADDCVLGVISVLHHQENAFSDAHLEWLQVISQEVALALVNASQYQQAQRRLAEMTLIQHLGQIINRRLDVQDLLDEVVSQLAIRLEYPQIRLFLKEGETLDLAAYFGPCPERKAISIHEGIVGRVARSGEISFIPDVSQDQDYLGCIGDTVAELAVPIFREDQVIGVLNVETHRHDQLSSQDRDILKVLADQISVALDNAVLYEQVRSHAEELEKTVSQRTIELTELYKLSQEIGYMLSEEELMKLLLEHLWIAVGADAAIGFLLNKPVVKSTGVSSLPISPTGMEQLRRQVAGYLPDTFNGEVEVDPIEVIPGDKFREEIHSFRDFMFVTVSGSSEVLGVLVAASHKEDVFREDQAKVLETFSHQAATAIERLKALQAAERERMEGLVEHLPIGVLLLDSEFQLLVANPAGRQMLEDIGVFVQGEKDRITHLGNIAVGELIGWENGTSPREISIGGQPRRAYMVQARPIDSDLGQWVLTLRNVTQERENQARIQMQERLATVGQMAAGIAHDFNNIMAAILVYADLIISDPDLPEMSRERLSIIQQQVKRAASLIRQILDFSRRAVMDQMTLDLLPFMKELEKMLVRVMPETIKLNLSYQADDYIVKADPTRLQQVFINLAVNSRDAMPNGGLLEFRLTKLRLTEEAELPVPDMSLGDWVSITVIDTGTGIAQAILPHIFEPFFTTKPVGQGTGLGLAQVYGIIKQHDGFIDVESRQGMGTQFNIYLPAQPVHVALPGSGGLVNPVDGSGQAVLIVEDDPATLEALQALLKAFNYNVIAARNGREALQIYHDRPQPISLIVSDIVMPRMGGVALYRALHEEDPEVKFLFVTGHPLDEDIQVLLEQGLVHWLQKPFSVREFNQAVRSIVQG